MRRAALLAVLLLVACGGLPPSSPSDGSREPSSAAPLIPSVAPEASSSRESSPAPRSPTERPTPLESSLAGILAPWSPNPIDLPQDALAFVDQACRAVRTDLPAGSQLMVVDARGDGLVSAYYASKTELASCEGMDVDASGRIGDLLFGNTSALEAGVPGATAMWTEDSSRVEAPIEAFFLTGRAGSEIARVELPRPGEPTIVAALANGWFALWSPWSYGDAPITTLQGFDASGAMVAEIEP